MVHISDAALPAKLKGFSSVICCATSKWYAPRLWINRLQLIFCELCIELPWKNCKERAISTGMLINCPFGRMIAGGTTLCFVFEHVPDRTRQILRLQDLPRESWCIVNRISTHVGTVRVHMKIRRGCKEIKKEFK